MPDDAPPMPPSAEFIAQVTRAQRELQAFILSMVRQAADADDVLQEANLVLWRKAAEFDPARAFMPWAMRVAQWQALAHLKRGSGRDELPLAPMPPVMPERHPAVVGTQVSLLLLHSVQTDAGLEVAELTIEQGAGPSSPRRHQDADAP